MKKIKRIKSVYCLMLCLSLFLAACSKDGSPGNDIEPKDSVSKESTVFDAIQEREWVYVPEVLTVGDEHADYERMQPVGDSFFYVSRAGEAGDSTKSICRYSLADGNLTSVPIHWPEGGDDWDVGYQLFAQDQSLYMTANVYPDSGSMQRFLCRFDAEGNCLFSKDITEQAGQNVSLRRLAEDGQGRLSLFLDNGEILLYTSDGEYYNSVVCSLPENQEPVQIIGACSGADGRFYVCIGQESRKIAGEDTESKNDIRCSLMEIDFENARLSEAVDGMLNINGLCAALRHNGGLAGQDENGDSAEESGDLDSQYDLLLYDDRAVYGYRFEAQKSDPGYVGEELFLWMDSDINGYFVTNLYLLEDGRLCATVADWLNDDRVIVTLERTRAEQAPRRDELVLATVNESSDLAAMAVTFNRGNSQYHLTVKAYESLTDLYNAILAKKPMDLIDLSGIQVQRLAAQGLLENLAPYVERSEVLGRRDFVDGILDAYTCGNVLVGIPGEFMVQTVVGNGAQMENKAGLTLEELYSAAERHPGAVAFEGVTKEELMQFCLAFYEDAFIDWDTGACHFDSEEFKALLQYVSQYPDSAASGREEEALSARVQSGEVLFAVAELYPPLILQDYEKMFGRDVACVGFPTADGRGGHFLISSDVYGIAAVSEHKESAWKFIEESLTEEQSELSKELWITYPALKKTLDERAEIAVGRGELTWDDVDVVLELIPDAKPFFSVKADEIIRIVNEEAPACYSGQKGIEDVAGIIQNRVQVYVDENR